ncbi:MAG: glutathione S-transferase [Alphaproteobacteria bacterium]|nr:glutathione S-transferase [Alphaproteobacteria bacterium]
MKLLHSPVSPYVRKVMITLHEKGQAENVELVSFSPIMPTDPIPQITEHNPLGKVPTLILPDGTRMVDSRVISEYLDHRFGGPRLFPEAAAERWDALTLMSIADGVPDAGILVMLENVLRPEEARNAAWIKGQMTKVHNAVAAIEARVDPASDRFQIGDVATICALGWLDFRMPDLNWRDGHARLADWYETRSQRPSVLATMPKPLA